MHLIVDIRSSFPINPIIILYASNWVDLWHTRHPEHRISYIHFSHQECPPNGQSVIVSQPTWWGRGKRLRSKGTSEIFRCVNFSKYPPYDSKIETISHIFDYVDILYPKIEPTGIQKILKVQSKNKINKSYKIIVPSLQVGQESVSLIDTKEESIEIIPYLEFQKNTNYTNILSQLSITGKYWIYDGSYGSEANIPNLLQGYKTYRELGGTYTLILMGLLVGMELRNISDQIQKMNLTGFVRIIGTLEAKDIESLYQNANGWIYIGAYYAGGPKIELARTYHIPLLISHIPTFQDFFDNSITIHPNHLSTLGSLLQELETSKKEFYQKITNEKIMQAYEKIIAEKS
ncbi:hypothetical protein HOO68_03105 [Candidatus Gracilibacteria bacterium]|nr:hypothetical protein [Candidatus Gracilibacteria bacterium]